MGYESVWAFGMLLKIDKKKFNENSENLIHYNMATVRLTTKTAHMGACTLTPTVWGQFMGRAWQQCWGWCRAVGGHTQRCLGRQDLGNASLQVLLTVAQEHWMLLSSPSGNSMISSSCGKRRGTHGGILFSPRKHNNGLQHTLVHLIRFIMIA